MYTIDLLGSDKGKRVQLALERAVAKSKFTASFTVGERGHIHVKPVRLREAKLYCGQHPGECDLGATRKGRWLEWADWVEFHDLVNDTMDRLGEPANIWTNPPERMDHGRKMWVRRADLGRRLRWEWEDEHDKGGLGRPTRIWNHGTPDQFGATP